mmetsp:Transcript_41701/g.103617  ORF Transcript_41701/g.103617 Transcript_41701/m.103617 type:complete len:252 (+) Transcript_41701:452-1207(+)
MASSSRSRYTSIATEGWMTERKKLVVCEKSWNKSATECEMRWCSVTGVQVSQEMTRLHICGSACSLPTTHRSNMAMIARETSSRGRTLGTLCFWMTPSTHVSRGSSSVERSVPSSAVCAWISMCACSSSTRTLHMRESHAEALITSGRTIREAARSITGACRSRSITSGGRRARVRLARKAQPVLCSSAVAACSHSLSKSTSQLNSRHELNASIGAAARAGGGGSFFEKSRSESPLVADDLLPTESDFPRE